MFQEFIQEYKFELYAFLWTSYSHTYMKLKSILFHKNVTLANL